MEHAEDVLSVLGPMLGAGFGEPEVSRTPQPAAEVELDKEADRVRRRVGEALSAAAP